jgi:DNA-binding transcriptional LysR family regulator
MRVAVAIADAGTVTLAAGRLGRTPAALSMQLRKLEETLNRRLFDRTRGGMRPTPDGERLLPHARRMIEAECAAREAFSGPALEGQVRVGLIDDVGGVRFSEALAAFARRYPQVTVEVVVAPTARLGAMLDAGGLDLAILAPGGAIPWRADDLVVHDEPLVWVAARDMDVWSARPLPLAAASDGCAWRRTTLDALDRAGLAYRIAYQSDASEPLAAAAAAGLAVAALPLSRVTGALRVLGAESGAPTLGRARAALRVGHTAGRAAEALAARICEGFAAQAPEPEPEPEQAPGAGSGRSPARR